jgi:hypothetical protein
MESSPGDLRPVAFPDHPAVLTNIAFARLEGYFQKHLQDIDTTTSSAEGVPTDEEDRGDALARRPRSGCMESSVDCSIGVYLLHVLYEHCTFGSPSQEYAIFAEDFVTTFAPKTFKCTSTKSSYMLQGGHDWARNVNTRSSVFH